ncbi:MAG TPA: bifunctional 2-methylcitrate synthase/citrate synthase [Acidimicrobiales bacterium]|nr:bifunctional 2-methylcitrate synthase/citrate synthase [Acidimicrobiales bacterium]
MAGTPEEIRRGLVGVVADTTSISMVNEATNSLLYRGYPVQELAQRCSFEEVAYLIWHGDLPSSEARRELEAAERAQRAVPGELATVLASLPRSCHPMDVLRTAVSYLGATDPNEADASRESNLAKAVSLWAKLPTIVAAEQRRRHDEAPIPPDPSLSFAENFFHMCFGAVPDPETVRAFEVSLVLYAEHSFNASTFTARVITSTLSDIYSAVTGAIGALKGPLHGGANEAVMAMLLEIEDPAAAQAWLKQALAEGRKIMGFGHRVYKHGDSRVPTMRRAFEDLARRAGATRLWTLYENLEAAMLAEKGIHPNLDYPTGPAYYLMGFDIPTFTPIFVMSRITGWTAHVMEQLEANSLIRPLSAYVGPAERSVPS